jgi:PAS domain S-box-containing protein
MNQAIVIVDSEGTVTHWDPTAEQFFGHSASDVIGRSIELIIPEEFRQPHRAGLHRAMSGGERHLEGAATHLPVLHADGTVACHPARFTHISDPTGRLVAAAAVFGPPTPEQAHWTPIQPNPPNTPSILG